MSREKQLKDAYDAVKRLEEPYQMTLYDLEENRHLRDEIVRRKRLEMESDAIEGDYEIPFKVNGGKELTTEEIESLIGPHTD